MVTVNDSAEAWGFLRPLTWQHVLLVMAVLVAAKVLSTGVRWLLGHWAERARPRLRLSILRLIPLARLVLGTAAVVLAVPILVEPTLGNVVALVASVGLVLAFGLKDYGSSLLAGLAAVLENTYQPGDWIAGDGTDGEVKSIDRRGGRIVAADDTDVTIRGKEALRAMGIRFAKATYAETKPGG